MFFDTFIFWDKFFYRCFTAKELRALRAEVNIQKKRIDALEQEIHKRGRMVARNHEYIERDKKHTFF